VVPGRHRCWRRYFARGAPRLRFYFTVDDADTCTLRHVEVLKGPLST